MAEIAAVQDLRLLRLGHGNLAAPSDLGGGVAEPDDLQPEDVAGLGRTRAL
jgi:hypothetical protein